MSTRDFERWREVSPYLDAGVTSTEQPYLILEYVGGKG
jgi:hypothetical protein